MNCHRPSPSILKKSGNLTLIQKIRAIPVVPRVYLYVLLMTMVGTAVGEARYQFETKECNAKADCWLLEPTQRRTRELGVGAIGGMLAATLISIPALLSEDS